MLVLLDNLGDVPYTRRLFKSSLSDARKRLSHKRKGPVVDRRKAKVVDRRCPRFPTRQFPCSRIATLRGMRPRSEREGDGLDEG
jgi:hypothetical protein